jgi:hypothetical protein
MNFDRLEDLRKALKAKLAKKEKTSRKLIVAFIKEYIKK